MILKKDEVTQELLHEYLNYDPTTGFLTWAKKLSKKTVVGRRAGTKVTGRDNRILKIFGQVFIEHRLIWLYVTGYRPEKDEHIDHIDHIEDNNSWGNLRLVTQAENNKNQSKRSDNTSGVVGVRHNAHNGIKKFTAEILANGKKRTKSFMAFDEAVAQRLIWESELGFHSNHGITKPI